MDNIQYSYLTDPEKESWKKFSEQRNKELKSPEFMYLHRNSYEQMSWFQFLQNRWSLSTQNKNPFNMDNELEYSLRVSNFGPDIRQISDFDSSSYYLNKISQLSSQTTTSIKSTNPRPSFYIKGSQFGLASYKKYDNVFIPNSPKRSDFKFNSPFSYYVDRRIKVIEKEKPNIKKSLLLPEIANEWKSMAENKKSQIRNIWKNYLAIHHQLYQLEKEEKTQISINLKNTNDSENNNDLNSNLNMNENANNQAKSIMPSKSQLDAELEKNQKDLDNAIDETLKDNSI